MDSQATIRAPRGGQGLDQKELKAMPRWFTRNENWDFGGKPDPTAEQPGEPKSRKRRLATTFVFTIVFFAGASFAAIGGNFSASIAEDVAIESTTTDSSAEAAPAAEESAAPAADASAAAAAEAAASHDLSAPAESAAATADI